MNDRDKDRKDIFNMNATNHNKHRNIIGNAPQNTNEGSWKNTSKIRTSPSRSFGKSHRNLQDKILAPGPGAY